MAGIADFLDEALRDALQHRVALGVAERVVDRLEAVEIEEHDRAGDIAGRRTGERVAEERARGEPASSRHMIAQGALPDVAPESASPRSGRTRPRFGRPERTSMFARFVR